MNSNNDSTTNSPPAAEEREDDNAMTDDPPSAPPKDFPPPPPSSTAPSSASATSSTKPMQIDQSGDSSSLPSPPSKPSHLENAPQPSTSSTGNASPATRLNLKERVMSILPQVREGCGRVACSNPNCSANKDFKKPATTQEALRKALDLAKKPESDVKICTIVEPLAYSTFDAMFASADSSSSPSPYREIVHKIGQSFGDPDVLDVSFGRETKTESTEDDPGVDFDDITKTYDLINGNEAVANALSNALNRICSTLEYQYHKQTEPQHLRKYLILLLNPAFFDPSLLETVKRVCKCIMKLPPSMSKILVNWFASFDHDRLESLQTMLQQYISIKWIDTKSMTDVAPVIKTLDLVHRANDVSGHLTFQSFYNDAVNEEFPARKSYHYWVNPDDGFFSFCNHYWLLDPANKAKILQLSSYSEMNREYRQAMFDNLLGARTSPYLNLVVSRNNIVQDALRSLQQREAFKKPLRVKFRGEEGIDEGGVQKEFFQLIIRELFDQKYGMFEYDSDAHRFWFNKDAFESGSEFELIGILLGLAIYNGVILDIHFPNVVYKKLVKPLKPTLDDVADFKPELVKGLKKLLDFDGDVKNTFLRTFSFEYDYFGETRVQELKEDGANIELTKENREEYVDLYTNYIVNDSVKRQFEPFARGFHLVCGGEVFEWFRWEELELLVCGSKELDFDALEEAARYEDGFYHDSATVELFWEVIHELDETQKKKFLFFTTGSDRVPIRGLGDLVITISKNGDDETRLPSAHTCFNHLLLPEYTTKEKLKEQLLKAIDHAEGFGML